VAIALAVRSLFCGRLRYDLAHAVVSPVAGCGIKADGPDAVQAMGRIALVG
jgi:hypothetical protein